MNNIHHIRLVNIRIVLAMLFAMICMYTQAQNKWKTELQKSLVEFKNCMESGKEENCRSLVGKSVNIVYDVNDFYSQSKGRYLSAFEIADELTDASKWKKLGPAYDQKILNKSQELANARKPVIAVYKDKAGEAQHAVLLLPGQLRKSGSWGMEVPNAVSFFTHDPAKSFVDKSLSYAFSKSMLLNIELYARN